MFLFVGFSFKFASELFAELPKRPAQFFLIGYRVFCYGYFILKVMPAGNKERLTLETNLLKSFSVTFVS